MNWYQKVRLNIKTSRSTQEWWIDQAGRIVEADSYVRDENGNLSYNHETRAVEEAQKIVKKEMLEDPIFSQAVPVVFGEMGNYKQFDPIASVENLNNWADERASEGELTQEQLFDIYKAISQATGLSEELIGIAFGQGGDYAARDYAIKNWKWIALRGKNLETYTLTDSDLNSIRKGLERAYGQTVDNLIFDISVRSNNTFYTEVPFSDIEKGLVAITKHKLALASCSKDKSIHN